MKKKLSILLCAVTMFTSIVFGACNNVVPPPDDREDLGKLGKVDLAILAVSDVHFSNKNNENIMRNYPLVIKETLELTGNKLDAITVSGDFSEGYERDYDTLMDLSQGAAPDIPLIVSYGNHEGGGKHNMYVDKFGLPVDNVRMVKGFTFICVGAHTGDTYTETQNTWLDGKLSEAAAATPTKPIFTLIHHPVKGTNEGILSPAGVPTLRPALAKNKQAFVLAGHEHLPLAENSLWKGEFIAYKNSSLNYLITEPPLGGQIPGRSQFTIIRVTDKNMIVLDQYELGPSALKAEHLRTLTVDYNKFLEGK